jgi:hypothetical protein
MSQSQFDRMIQDIDPRTLKLLPGKVLIDQDPLPDKEGSLFLPQRDDQPNHPANTGTVVALGYGEFFYDDESSGKKKQKLHSGFRPDELGVGDRVVYRLLMSDLNRKRVFTDIRRIDGVIEP